MRIIWAEKGCDEFESWFNDPKMLRRVCLLLKDIRRSPYSGIGRPEELKYEMSGLWSREIDGKNRIVYKVEEDSVVIFRCRGHYNDK